MLNQQQIKDKKVAIEKQLSKFNPQKLADSANNLLNTLGYKSTRLREETNFTAEFLEQLALEKKLNRKIALYEQWENAHFVCQFAKVDLANYDQTSLVFDTETPQLGLYSGFLFVVIELNQNQYTRTQLATIVRELNKHFLQPVNIFFYYNNLLSIAFIHRRQNKNNGSKQVLGKVSIIKDIDLKKPKRSQTEILYDLTTTNLFEDKRSISFQEIADAWYNILDTKELNKRFYRDLRNWYAWANQEINIYQPNQTPIPDRDKQQFILRLITRLIFCWFLKEKQLIADTLFDEQELQKNILDLSDKHKSNYYKAILQNLFFATLNVEIEKREFRITKEFQGKNTHYFDHSRYRSVKEFKEKENALEQLFKDVPFLNGGLFECLDTKDAQGNETRIDFFTDHPKKTDRLVVPNFLFFADDVPADLSKWYNDPKRSKQKIDGLVSLLNHYKFTIEENTPLEEEVALDPELLGKVFENLLAEFNDESQTTKRKETGSFYTPREIVDYMTTEALKNYFNTTLNAQDFTHLNLNLDHTITELFSDSKDPAQLSDTQKNLFLQAISNLTILDPACGSGAFPMGILHKLTHLLQKIDPNNQLWFEMVVKKLPVGLREEFKTQHTNQRIDYVRKLGIIYDTIYGIDIQPIAVHIAKLRFFISLIIEQQKNPNLPNFGIQTLPNLEFKFVCANTLIGLKFESIVKDIDAAGRLFGGSNIHPILNQIEDLRKDFFETKDQHEKNKLKTQFNTKQTELKSAIDQAIKADEGLKKITQLDNLSQWQPFNDQHSAPFFDPLYMFGIKNGFDIVIGNPPYVEHKKLKEISQTLRKLYTTYSGTADLYVYFYENGMNLLKQNGVLSFITSNKFIKTGYGENLRNHLTSFTIEQIIDFTEVHVFNALVASCVILVSKKSHKDNKINICFANDNLDNFSNLFQFVKQNQFTINQNTLNGNIWQLVKQNSLDIKEKIEYNTLPLGNIANIYRGVTTGYNPAFIIDQATKQQLIEEDSNNENIIKPLLQGRNIKKWIYNNGHESLLFIPWHFPLHLDTSVTGASTKAEQAFIKQYPFVYRHLTKFKEGLHGRNKDETGIRYEWYALQRCAASYYSEFEEEKIIWGLTSDKWTFAYDNGKHYLPSNGYILTSTTNIKYLLALLNSRLMEFYFGFIGIMTAGGAFTLKHDTISKLPIPKISIEAQAPFIRLVDYILFLKKHPTLNALYASYFERLIDGMVYELYFGEEFLLANCPIIAHLGVLPALDAATNQEAQLSIIAGVYERLTQPSHLVCTNLLAMQHIEEIKIMSKQS